MSILPWLYWPASAEPKWLRLYAVYGGDAFIPGGGFPYDGSNNLSYVDEKYYVESPAGASKFAEKKDVYDKRLAYLLSEGETIANARDLASAAVSSASDVLRFWPAFRSSTRNWYVYLQTASYGTYYANELPLSFADFADSVAGSTTGTQPPGRDIWHGSDSTTRFQYLGNSINDSVEYSGSQHDDTQDHGFIYRLRRTTSTGLSPAGARRVLYDLAASAARSILLDADSGSVLEATSSTLTTLADSPDPALFEAARLSPSAHLLGNSLQFLQQREGNWWLVESTPELAAVAREVQVSEGNTWTLEPPLPAGADHVQRLYYFEDA